VLPEFRANNGARYKPNDVRNKTHSGDDLSDICEGINPPK